MAKKPVGALIYQAELSGPGDGLGAAPNRKFAKDIVEMLLDSSYGDEESFRYLAIRQTLGDEF